MLERGVADVLGYMRLLHNDGTLEVAGRRGDAGDVDPA